MNSERRRRTTYILPIRSPDAAGAAELARYVRALEVGEVIVVDGSATNVFEAHRAAFAGSVAHIAPNPDVAGCNGKVRGVLSGLRQARGDYVIVADDDVRYDSAALDAVLQALERADVVRPQNYFSPVPWHALLDNARQLINRGLDGDWPGTLAFRRSALPRGYNADALFENLELVRTVRARGGREAVLFGVFVRRMPPHTAHFFSQRVRQAYDEFARPMRLLVALSLVPLATYAICARQWWVLVLIFGSGEALALRGLLRSRAYRYISPLALLAVPVWVAERAFCAWAALYQRLRYGGVRYAGRIVRDAVCSRTELRRWAA